MTVNNQVKTKKRVADHGEVFTHEKEISSILKSDEKVDVKEMVQMIIRKFEEV